MLQLSTKQMELDDVAVLGPRKVRLSWRTVTELDQIRGYHVHIQEVSGEPQQFPKLNTLTVSGVGTSSHTLTHLQPNTAYQAFLVPYSLAGLARPSNLQTFTTKEDVPETSPSNVELKLHNSTAAVAYWHRPSQDSLNGKLMGYKIEIYSNNSLVTNFTLDPSATSLLLSNLTTAVIYKVRLAAFTRAGMGPYSSPVSLKVEPSLLYRPHPALTFPPDAPPGARLVTETWFVSMVGLVAILLILTLVACIVARRRSFKDKSFGHYTGGYLPLCTAGGC